MVESNDEDGVGDRNPIVKTSWDDSFTIPLDDVDEYINKNQR